MSEEIVVGVRLKADGSGLVGEVRVSKTEMDKLTGATKGTGKAAKKTGRDVDRMGKQMRSTRNDARRLNDQQKNLNRTLLASAGAWFSLRTASNLIEDYRVQEQAVAALNASIKSMGRETDGLSESLQQLASQIQADGIIGDEAIIKGQSFLTTYGAITDKLLPRTSIIMADIAAKMGGDTVSAANLLGKASMGMVGDLARVGITLSDTAKEGKDFEVILGEIEQQVSGMNAALAETETGRLDQLGNDFGDLSEQFGGLITDLSGEVTPGLGLLARWGQSAISEVRETYAEVKAWRDKTEQELLESMGLSSGADKPKTLVIEITGGKESTSQPLGKNEAKRLNNMMKEGAKIFQQTRTPLEEYSADVMRLNELWQMGAIETDTYHRAIIDAQDNFLEETNSQAIQWSDIWTSAGNRFSAGIGDAVADVMFDQASSAEKAKALFKSMGKQVVSTLVEIGVKKAALFVAEKVGLGVHTAASTAAAGATAAAWAPAAALTSLASFGGNSIPANAGMAATFGLAEGLALAGVAHDGLYNVPQDGTYLLQGGEMVVNKGNSDKIRSAADGADGGTVIINQALTFNAIDAAGIDELLQSRRGLIKTFAIEGVMEARESIGKSAI